MSITFDGITRARARLAYISEGLRYAATGGVTARAAQEVANQVRSVSKSKLSKHRLSGEALSDTRVDVAGSLVLLHEMPPAQGRQWNGQSYLSLQPWWPFRSGMPPFVVNRAIKIFEAELFAAVGGERSPLALVDEAAEEVAAEKSRAKFKKDVARIWRHSTEGKAARAAARKAARVAAK